MASRYGWQLDVVPDEISGIQSKQIVRQVKAIHRRGTCPARRCGRGSSMGEREWTILNYGMGAPLATA